MPFFIKSTIILFLLGLSISSNAQRIIPDEKQIDYSCENKTLRNVLFELSELTGVTIAWQEQIIPSDSIVNISVRKERLGKLIDHLINSHGLKYKIVGNQIAIIYDNLRDVDDKLTISGYIYDERSGERLIDAHIFSFDRENIAVSNAYGFYSMTLKKGVQRLYASYLGYERGVVEIELTKDSTVNIGLQPSNYLKEVVISESKIIPLDHHLHEMTSIYDIALDRINYSLPLAGEADVIRTAMSSSGVSSGADGFGGMSVRGGAENQNLILFDGIPVYSSKHAFGLFSIFNSKLVKSARLFKGTIPAHYSGRLSSVLDIRTREGNMKELAGDISVGLFTGKASIEGPIKKDRSSFLFSARRTFVDPWIGAATEALNRSINKEGRTEFYFYDINGKLNFNLGEHSRLYLSYYSGRDLYDTNLLTRSEDDDYLFEDKDEVLWDTGNQLAALRWNTRLSHKIFMNAFAYRSVYEFNSFDHDRIDIFEKQSMDFSSARFDAAYYQSKIEDRGTRIEFDYIPNKLHSVKFGAGYVQHEFNPTMLLANSSDSIVSIQTHVSSDILSSRLEEPEINAEEFEFFLEDEIKFGQFTSVNLGYNHMFVRTSGANYHISQPRILFKTGSENYTFNATWGKTGQFLHSLVNTGLGVPIDVWLPSTDKIAPEEAWMLSTGHFVETKAMGRIGLEFFYKEMDNLTRYGDNALLDISADSNWESLMPVGKGNSYGMEFSIIKNQAKTSYNLSYTLSWSNRKFDEINNGESFRSRFDRRHVVNFSFIRKLNPDIDIAVNWQFGSGAPITIPSGNRYFEYNEEAGEPILVLVYEGINNELLPAYHRLDFGFNFRHQYDWGSSVFTLGLYNAYNRQNPFYRDIVVDLTDPADPVKFEDVTILPVLPTISYSIQF